MRCLAIVFHAHRVITYFLLLGSFVLSLMVVDLYFRRCSYRGRCNRYVRLCLLTHSPPSLHLLLLVPVLLPARVTLWVPLRPLVPNLGDDFGAIQIAVTYSDDCVAQGWVDSARYSIPGSG